MSFQSENTLSSVNSMNQGSVSTKLSSLDRSMTIIDGCASESFGIINPDKISQQEAQMEQKVVRQSSEGNNDLRPVVTVDNSLLIKIMARLKFRTKISYNCTISYRYSYLVRYDHS